MGSDVFVEGQEQVQCWATVMSTAYAVVWGKKAHHKEMPSVRADGFPSTLLLIQALPCFWTPPLLLLQDLLVLRVELGQVTGKAKRKPAE